MADVINLLTITYTVDQYLNEIETVASQQVFCDVHDITQSEFFSAGREGLHPAFVFDVFFGDYNGEKIIEFNGELYDIYRTYRRGDTVELYAQETIGVTEA